MSWAIAAQPGYWTSVETHFFYYLLRNPDGWSENIFSDAYLRSDTPESWLKTHNVSYNDFIGGMGAGLDNLIRLRSGNLQWIDGSPENILVGDGLLEMFPTAYIIHVVRDPRDVCLSMITSGFSEDWSRDLTVAAQAWRHYANEGKGVAERHPDRVLQIHQEDMREKPALVAEAIRTKLNWANGDATAQFLKSNRINSSFNKDTYLEESQYRTSENVSMTYTEFRALHAGEILAAAGDIAEHYGYADAAQTTAPEERASS